MKETEGDGRRKETEGDRRRLEETEEDGRRRKETKGDGRRRKETEGDRRTRMTTTLPTCIHIDNDKTFLVPITNGNDNANTSNMHAK